MSQPKTQRGWFKRIWAFAYGTEDEATRQVRRLQSQGSHIVRAAHLASTVMILLVSVATLITLGQHTFQTVVASIDSHHPNVVMSVALALLLVLVACMDLAAIYSSTMLRLLWSRHASRWGMIPHLAVVLFVMGMEGGTYAIMIWEYEHPTTNVAIAIGLARAFGAPVIAIYLSLAMVMSVTKADILAIAAMQAGIVGVQKIADLAGDPQTPLGKTWQVFDAASGPSPHDPQMRQLILVISDGVAPSLAPVPYVESGGAVELTSVPTPTRVAKAPTRATVPSTRTPPAAASVPALSDDVVRKVQLCLEDKPAGGPASIARRLGLPLADVCKAVARIQSGQAPVAL